jgi:anti-sigma regulatory factor (Ser/Thr protein kinase)
MCPHPSAAFPSPATIGAVAPQQGLNTGPGMTLAPEPQSAGKARAFVRERLRGLGFSLEVVSDGATVATELVTNAVTYAPGGPCWVGVRLSPRGRPVIEVHDSSTQPPVQQEPDFVAERGRGLHIVEKLCAGGWEYFPTTTGKTVVAWLR